MRVAFVSDIHGNLPALQAVLADLDARTIIGKPSLHPRMEAVPVVLPLPPAPDAGSIFKTQKTGGAKTAFAA